MNLNKPTSIPHKHSRLKGSVVFALILSSLLGSFSFENTAQAQALPTISLTSNYGVVTYVDNHYYFNQGTTPPSIFWTVSGATSVSLDNGVGTVSANGSLVLPASSTPLVYKLTATNAVGSATAIIGIQVQKGGSNPTINPNFLTVGDYTLKLTSTNENERVPNIDKTVQPGQPITFYAEFKKSGVHLSGADCKVTFKEHQAEAYKDDPPVVTTSQMSESGSMYSFTRSFSYPQNQVYEATCKKDNVTLSARNYTLINVVNVPSTYWRSVSSTDKQRLITPEDVEYMGAFRPLGSAGSKWGFGLSAITHVPVGDTSGANDGYPGSIFGWGFSGQRMVSEISIPVPYVMVTKDRDPEAPMSGSLQPFTEISGGIYDVIDDIQDLNFPGGLHYVAPQGSQSTGKIYWSYTNTYPAGVLKDVPVFGSSETNLSNLQPKGPWGIDGYKYPATSKYMFDIPKAWADQYLGGKSIATGQAGLSIVSTHSHGPALIAFAPWRDNNPPAANSKLPQTSLLYYPPGDLTKDLVNIGQPDWSADAYAGGAWLTEGGKAAVMYARSAHVGGWSYEAGRLGGCDTVTGPYSWPNDPQLIFYDPNDLAKVAQGQLGSWQPQPYLQIRLMDYLVPSCNASLGAVAYDRSNGLIYISQSGLGDTPVIHTFQVTDSCRRVNKKVAANQKTKLTAWDSVSCSTPVSAQTTFYADYTNDTGVHIAGATCVADFSDGNYTMTEVGGVYQAQRTFSRSGKYEYNVSCKKSGNKSTDLNAQIIVGGSTGSTDTTPPNVSITSPTSGSTVSGTTSVTTSVTDNVGISFVDFKIDGVSVNVDSSAPYLYSWNTLTATNGQHSLTATARDNAGNSTTSATVSVNVSNTVTVPPPGPIPPPPPGPVPPPPPVNSLPIGNFDEIRLTDGVVRGWALDPDNKTAGNSVHIYMDAPAGTGRTPVDGFATNTLRDDVNTTYGATGDHGFEYNIPAQFRNGVPHAVYVYAIDMNDNTKSTLLNGSPKTFTLSTPPSVPTISQVAVSNITNNGATVTWVTDVAAYSRVRYCTSTFDCSAATSENATATTSHTVNLTGLTPCSVYYYQPMSRITTQVAIVPKAIFYTKGCVGNAAIQTYDTSHVTTASGASLTVDKLKLTIPSGLSEDTDFQVKKIDPIAFFNTAGAPSSKVLLQNESYDVKAFEEDLVTSLNKSITVTISYNSIPIGIDPNSLEIFRYDGSSWSKLSNCTHKESASEITCTTTRFSVFSIFGEVLEGMPIPPPPVVPVPVPTPTPVPVDGTLVKSSNEPAIYIMEYGKKRPFANWEAFMGLGFVGKPIQVIDVSGIPTGGGIFTANERHTRGTLVLLNGTVYFLGAEVKYGFPSLEVFNSWGRSWGEIVPGNQHDQQLPDGPVVKMKQ
jgi:hypothetical protein